MFNHLSFSTDDIKKLISSLSNFSEVLDERWNIVLHQWENLKLDWTDKNFDQFYPVFESLSEAHRQANKDYENLLFILIEKSRISEDIQDLRNSLDVIITEISEDRMIVSNLPSNASPSISRDSIKLDKLIFSEMKKTMVQNIVFFMFFMNLFTLLAVPPPVDLDSPSLQERDRRPEIMKQKTAKEQLESQQEIEQEKRRNKDRRNLDRSNV